MSVIEDSRKVLQDYFAPELRAIAVRLDTLEKRLESHEIAPRSSLVKSASVLMRWQTV